MKKLEKVYNDYVGDKDRPMELIGIILAEDCPMDYGIDCDCSEDRNCFHCWMQEVDDDE